MTDDSCVVTRRASKGTAVADFLFYVAHDGTFRALVDRKNVSDRQGGFFAAVDESTGVEALGGDEGFGAELVTVGVTENDASKGCTASRVMDDFFHDTANVAVAFCVVQRAELGRRLVVVSVCLEDGMRTPLCPNDPTHCLCSCVSCRVVGWRWVVNGIVRLPEEIEAAPQNTRKTPALGLDLRQRIDDGLCEP